MRPQELEPETEALLLQLAPELAEQWQGATPEEVERIEKLAGRRLPGFYRWFLSRMGRSMGPLRYPSLDFSVSQILACYAEELVEPDPRFLLIGYESNEDMPLHLFYDFDHRAREDARVVKRHPLGGPLHNQFDTFREMLTWNKFNMYRLRALPQRCSGAFRGEARELVDELDRVMKRLGFTKPIPTGPCCALYNRSDAALSLSATPRSPPSVFHFFDLSGPDIGAIRRILGIIAKELAIQVEVDDWAPPTP